MRNFKLSRRGFLKLSSTACIAATAGVSGMPSPLLAKTSERKGLDKLLKYEVGTKTTNFCEMCFWNCGVDVYTLDGKLKKLEGNKLNPNNYGTLCAKGNAGIASTYDPDRIKYPMIRTGERGEGKWKRVSWDEAYEYIHEKLEAIIDKYGAESIAGFAHGTGERYFRQLINALGSPNITVASFSECRGSRAIAYSLTYGGGGIGGHEYYDMKNTKYMIVFGRNMSGAVQVREARDFVEGISRGAKLVYVDPRQSETATMADKWLQIKAGTDLALSLGLIHVIIRDNLANMDFVRKYCYGYNELREHVKKYTPEWAQKECGIKAKVIEEIAWEFAKQAPHVIAIPARRIARYANDTQSARAIAILNALMGNYGTVGGVWVNTKYPINLPEDEIPRVPDVKRADGAGDKYIFSPTNLGLTNGIYKATLTQEPYPIKAWITYETNPIGHTATENAKVFESIKKLDFLMVIDTQMNDTAYYADIVLPESTYLERDDAPFIQRDAYPFITLRKAAIKPLYDTKHIFQMCRGIVEKFGYDEYFTKSPQESIEDLYKILSQDEKDKLDRDGVLIYHDADPFPNSSGKTLNFPTTTGKIQLYVPELEPLHEKFGDVCSPLPTYIPPKMPKDGEFRLLFGMTPAHSHARSQNNWLLMELQDTSPVWIHPDDAEKLGLKNSDQVIITNTTTGYKSLPQELKITKRINKGNVFIHHGYGHISKNFSIGYNKGTSTAFFCSNDVDPISGCSGHNNGFVTIQRA